MKAKIISIKPVQESSLAGFNVINNTIDIVKSFLQRYKTNIKHTYEHKLVFAIIEKQLRGKNTVNSLTHDLDKMFLYMLGLPHNLVSKIHRKISAHHFESNKHYNIFTMAYDNIASSPEFKPEKRLDLRSYFTKSSELQSVKGLAELLEKYNYGENLNFNQIKNKTGKYKGFKGLKNLIRKAFKILFR